jgi:competence ComEA-like helix-hairpin-helix protein
MKRLINYKTFLALSLVALIIVGGIFLFQQQPWSKEPLEITLTTPTSASIIEWEIYVDGAVENPGWYSLEEAGGIGEVVSLAGGSTSNTNPVKAKLYIYENGKSIAPQLISINRAEDWLLDALPGIGTALAQNIIQYRQENGPFVLIEELLLVSGIGEAKYDGVKDFITVE